MGRFFLTLILGVGMFGLVAWQLGLLTSEEARTGDEGDQPTSKVEPSVLGVELYAAAPDKVVTPGLVRGPDPIKVSGHMNVLEKGNVPSEVDGKLLFIGTEVPEGAAQVAGVSAFLGEDYHDTRISQGDGYLVKLYRRLYEGDVVTNEQMVAMVDPSRALAELMKNRLKIVIAQLEQQNSEAAAKEAELRYLRAYDLHRTGAMTAEEFGTYKLAKFKYAGENLKNIEAIDAAKYDARSSQIIYGQHMVRNKIPKQRCQIQTVYRRLGEAITGKDSILELWSLDRLMAEALVPAQYLPRLPTSRISVEPVQEQAPYRQLTSHKAAINAVAVTGDAKDPLILSASDDKTVCVWSPSAEGPIRVLDHSSAVRAVACAPAGAKVNYWLTGDSDGRVWFWNQAKEPDQQKTELPKQHRDAITSLAISPDGRFFATGGLDGAIYLYYVDEDKPGLKYPFDAEHGVDQAHLGPVTSLTFTPQSRLVSASRDQTLRVWNLREKGAYLQGKILENRAGNVGLLGVSPDGSRMLFDRGKDLQILSVVDGRTVSTLHNPSPFDTLALYSSDASVLVTAGLAEGRLQLWHAPDDASRGYEVRQLVTEKRSPVTCAGYSNFPGSDSAAPFLASGTQDGYVYLWALPTQLQVKSHRMANARLRLVTQNQGADGQIRVGVEVLNPVTPEHRHGRFRPGQPVSIVFE